MITNAILRRGLRLWAAMELALPPAFGGLLTDRSTLDPWADGSARLRLGATGLLAEEVRGLTRATWERTGGDPARWLAAFTRQAEGAMAAAAMLEHGRVVTHPSARLLGRLNGARAIMAERLAWYATARRRGDISTAKLQAWSGEEARGMVRCAGQMGAVEHWPDDLPMRRVLTWHEDSCPSCPAKARTYRSIEHYLAVAGGWPGDGSDTCGGNCNCSLQPATAVSVYDADELRWMMDLAMRGEGGTVGRRVD